MYICLLRHGETDWNNLGKLQGKEDIPINNTGIKQIEETIKYLKEFDWKIIITSPLLRAKTSAEIISKGLGNIKIHEEINFIERDYGKASGMTTEEIKLNFPDGKWIGTESFEILQNRMVNTVLKYIHEYEGNNIIVVSHGAAINSVLAYLSKNQIGTGKTILRNACLTLLEKNNNEIKIIFFNKIVEEIINIL
jgi:uncharacterized phosphatase